MKEASAQFEKEDEMRRRLERKDFFIGRMEQRKEFYEAAVEREERYQKMAEKHKALMAKLQREEDVEVFTEEVEVVLSEKTTVLP